MKKVISLFLSMTLILSSIIVSSAAASIPSSVLTLINQYNYSSAKFDTSANVAKWLKQSSLNANDKAALTNLCNGVQDGADYVKTKGYVTQREVIKPWATAGKADAKLGQAYESQVSLVMGQIDWEHYIIKTKVWVKNNAVTKVDYSTVAGNYSAALKKFMTDNDAKLDKYRYENAAGAYSILKTGATNSLTDLGMTFTAESDATYFNQGLMMFSDVIKNYDVDNYYYIATVKVDKTIKIDSDSLMEGLVKNDYTETFIDPATNGNVPYDNGWVLEAGKTYKFALGFNDVAPVKAYNGTYFYMVAFGEVK